MFKEFLKFALPQAIFYFYFYFYFLAGKFFSVFRAFESPDDSLEMLNAELHTCLTNPILKAVSKGRFYLGLFLKSVPSACRAKAGCQGGGDNHRLLPNSNIFWGGCLQKQRFFSAPAL